jgi:tetratricopeptide (TPR) repeat protein
MLLQADQYTEAENEYRAALDLMARQGDKRNVNKLRAGLVEALAGQGKSREAMTLITSLFQSITPIPGELYLLHARLLLQTGEKARAIGEYLRALDSDAALANAKLAAQLGLQPDNLDPDFVPGATGSPDATCSCSGRPTTNASNAATGLNAQSAGRQPCR